MRVQTEEPEAVQAAAVFIGS